MLVAACLAMRNAAPGTNPKDGALTLQKVARPVAKLLPFFIFIKYIGYVSTVSHNGHEAR